MAGLRTRRRMAEMSQAQLANLVGKSPAWLSLVERGYLTPSQETLRQLLEQLDFKTEEQSLP